MLFGVVLAVLKFIVHLQRLRLVTSTYAMPGWTDWKSENPGEIDFIVPPDAMPFNKALGKQPNKRILADLACRRGLTKPSDLAAASPTFQFKIPMRGDNAARASKNLKAVSKEDQLQMKTNATNLIRTLRKALRKNKNFGSLVGCS